LQQKVPKVFKVPRVPKVLMLVAKEDFNEANKGFITHCDQIFSFL